METPSKSSVEGRGCEEGQDITKVTRHELWVCCRGPTPWQKAIGSGTKVRAMQEAFGCHQQDLKRARRL